MVDYFDEQMKKGTEPMMEVEKKYFIFPGSKIGWSILQIADPYVGPAAAAAILRDKLMIVFFLANALDFRIAGRSNLSQKRR